MRGHSKERSGAAAIQLETINLADSDNVIKDNIGLLSEKRRMIREAALTSLNHVLSLKLCGDSLDSQMETYTYNMRHLLPRAEEAELLLALRSIGLMAVTFQGDQCGSLFVAMRDGLVDIATNKAREVSLEGRIGAVQCLATLCFLSSVSQPTHELVHTKSVIDSLTLVIYDEEIQPALKSAALDALNLLLTVVSQNSVKRLFSEDIEWLNSTLESNDSDLTSSAAKSIVLFAELLHDALKESMDQYARFHLDMISSPVSWGDVIFNLEQVSLDKSSARSKTDKKQQRETLRQTIAFLQSNEPPREEITIKHFSLVLHTWASIVQMEHFRALLGEGLLFHLTENPNLMQIFEYESASISITMPILSKKERRRSLGPSSDAAKAAKRIKDYNRNMRSKDIVAISDDQM